MINHRDVTRRDQVILTEDPNQWRRIVRIPNDAGWFEAAYGAHAPTAHHITEVKTFGCNDSMSGHLTATHCERCDGCPSRGGPYGCHCECEDRPDDACEWCNPLHENREEW